VHLAVSGQIAKIESGLLFVKTPYGLQMRTISPNKADRIGLHDAQVGWAAAQAENFQEYMRRVRDPNFIADGVWPLRA